MMDRGSVTEEHSTPQSNPDAPSAIQVARRYVPIGDYALIGDCRGCALVSRACSIDWCAFDRFDAPPVFCRLLNADRGGFLSAEPTDVSEVERAYLEDSNVLRTIFTTATGRVAITDYTPVGRRQGAGVHDYVSLSAPSLLIRTIEGLCGEQHLELQFRPSLDYARFPARLMLTPRGVAAEQGPALHTRIAFSIVGDLARGRITVRAGQRHDLIVAPAAMPRPLSDEAVARLLAVTHAFWSEWIAYCRYAGPYQEIIRRGALTLLTYAPTGAIVAAATTSLPEEIGGERNWDYRYCWLRDATFTLYALAVLGYGGEALAFGRFLKRVCEERPHEIQIMYGVGAEMQLEEQLLEHLEGYRASRPVRIGNDAYKQRQIDVYGEFLDWAYLMTRLGVKFDAEDQGLFERFSDFVAAHIGEPGQGLWESRGAPRHYVYGKLMGWVALDRGLRLLGHRPHWFRVRDHLRDEILQRGVDPAGGHLLQAYDYAGTDAALLLTPMLGIPIDRSILERTIAVIELALRRGDYVQRYRTEDGLAGREGAFLICSFWLVDAYLALDRVSEARTLFERLIARANDVGLFAEEIDPESHDFLGNFPQAFTHLALIGNAIHLFLRDKYGADGLAGTHADRARRAVGAIFGWRGLWEACEASGRVGHFWSS
jgi:GH15 family glucan-1,4-alpha-glucosidase